MQIDGILITESKRFPKSDLPWIPQNEIQSGYFVYLRMNVKKLYL